MFSPTVCWACSGVLSTCALISISKKWTANFELLILGSCSNCRRKIGGKENWDSHDAPKSYFWLRLSLAPASFAFFVFVSRSFAENCPPPSHIIFSFSAFKVKPGNKHHRRCVGLQSRNEVLCLQKCHAIGVHLTITHARSLLDYDDELHISARNQIKHAFVLKKRYKSIFSPTWREKKAPANQKSARANHNGNQ